MMSGSRNASPRHATAPGAFLRDGGVAFAVHSFGAHAVDLCLFDPADSRRETARMRLERGEDHVWRGFVPGLGAGALYGYRVHGPWVPQRGLWFNSHKLLLDPRAKAVSGRPEWHPLMRNAAANGWRDFWDDGHVVPRSVVIDDAFDWGDDVAPRVPWNETVIYEMHVRGFTMRHPGLPEELRGTYAGLAQPGTIGYLKEAGITAVQLLPVHHHVDDAFLVERGLTNYWGYNSIAFFAPHGEYAAARDPRGQVIEFKAMVRELHRAGIEVILDVVYNHTAEGDENGPLLSLRGLDNQGYYLLNDDARCVNYTGCGNTLNAAAPAALALVIDSLRYWAEEMRVDGFRFDLAATMGRRGAEFDRDAPFFQLIARDPLLSRVKLIAEPWDLGPEGYQVGGFPPPWRELNGRYRDKVRRFWKGDAGSTAAFAKRLCGSDDIFGGQKRPPHASVNFVTSHDGFTLRDLWSYDQKHNEANLEENRDGDSHNNSWNCGVEGETADPAVMEMRGRLARACLASMFCSLGVPSLTMGDERWRTQQGNNNCYCQDNDLGWLDWSDSDRAGKMLAFVRNLGRFRREHPELRRQRHFTGGLDPFSGRRDVAWFDDHGEPMSHEKWHNPECRFFGAMIDRGTQGATLLLFNAGVEDVPAPLPPGAWARVFDTSQEDSFAVGAEILAGGGIFPSRARSVACLVLQSPGS